MKFYKDVLKLKYEGKTDISDDNRLITVFTFHDPEDNYLKFAKGYPKDTHYQY